MELDPKQSSQINREREQWLQKVRVDWYRIMRPLGTWVPWELRGVVELDDIEVEDYFHPALPLNKIHVQNCKVVCDRFALLDEGFPKNSICCEVGTDTGSFAKKILEISYPQELHLIDISFQNFRKQEFSSAIHKGVVCLHESDSVEALNKFPDSYFDWIYIDADHSYEGVKRDIKLAKTKIKSDGLLAFNDYMFWSHRGLESFGVMQAVNEFCLKENWEICYFALNIEAVNDVVLRRLE